MQPGSVQKTYVFLNLNKGFGMLHGKYCILRARR